MFWMAVVMGLPLLGVALFFVYPFVEHGSVRRSVPALLLLENVASAFGYVVAGDWKRAASSVCIAAITF